MSKEGSYHVLYSILIIYFEEYTLKNKSVLDAFKSDLDAFEKNKSVLDAFEKNKSVLDAFEKNKSVLDAFDKTEKRLRRF